MATANYKFYRPIGHDYEKCWMKIFHILIESWVVVIIKKYKNNNLH